MIGFFKQLNAVLAINIKSLPQRGWISAATVIAVAVVTSVLMWFQAMGDGFAETLRGSGSDSVAIVTRGGSRSEINSVVSREEMGIVLGAPGVVRQNGRPLASAELYVIVDGVKKSSLTKVNLPFRGIGAAGLALRDNVDIIEGRMFEAGRNEIIAGASVREQFAGFELGREVTFGNTKWQVVGIFSAGGAFDSELWADERTLRSQFRREETMQSMRLRLAEAGNVQPIKDFIDSDGRLNFDVQTEAEYFAAQSEQLQGIVFLGVGLSIVMALGALSGALNTMYTSVASRTRDIATLRAIGFGGAATFVGTLIESILLALIGAILGAAATYLLFDGMTASTLGSSFSQIVFSFTFSMSGVKKAVILALAVGFVGGLFPAFRAARMPVLAAFRS